MRIGLKHPIRAAIGDIATYHKTKGSILCAVRAAFEAHDLVVDLDGLPGNDGSAICRIRPADTTSVVCDCCAKKMDSAIFDECLAIQWYKMGGTGNWEYNAYIS